MSETYTVERNGVAQPLSNFEFLKGDNKGKRYLAPNVINDDTLKGGDAFDSVKNWLGVPVVLDIIQTFLKRTAQDAWLNNIDETTGEVNIPAFIQDIKDLASTGMKKGEILDRIEELQAQLGEMVKKMMPDADGKFNASAVIEAQKLTDNINLLKAQAEKRSRKKEVEAQPAIAVA